MAHSMRQGLAAVLAAGLVGAYLAGAAQATETRTPQAALDAAQRFAQCEDCTFTVSSRAPRESARRGLVDVMVGDANGISGYHAIMGYTGSGWDLLWAGNGSTRDVSRLPDKIVICMNDGGWTNLRKGPGTNYPRVGRISRPTVKKAFQMRLTEPGNVRREGVGWYRIAVNGQPAWVQNLRTMSKTLYGSPATAVCKIWQQGYDQQR